METPANGKNKHRLSFAAQMTAAVTGAAAALMIRTNAINHLSGIVKNQEKSVSALDPSPQKYPSPELTMQQIAEKVKKAMVIVEFDNGAEMGLCTGFIGSPDTIVTAKHCPGIKGAGSPELPWIKSIHEYPADSTYLARHNQNLGPYSFWYSMTTDRLNRYPDIVSIKFRIAPFSDREALTVATSESFSEEEVYYTVHFKDKGHDANPLDRWKWVVAYGSYMGEGLKRWPDGYVTKLIKMNIPNIRQGNSGSPVLNSRGTVVGVLSAISTEDNLALVTPLTTKLLAR